MSIHDRVKRFTVTGQHLELARNMNVRWGEMEWGAPEIDGKRPYGNGDMPRDVCRILELYGANDEELPDSARRRAIELHREMETVLQIILATGSFEKGDYDASRYGNDWRRVS